MVFIPSGVTSAVQPEIDKVIAGRLPGEVGINDNQDGVLENGEIVVRNRLVKETNGFNIRNFRSDVQNRGVIKSNHGQFIFDSPPLLRGTFADVKKVLIRAMQAPIPAVWFTTDDSIRRYGYGPIQKAPQTPQFDPYTVTFLCDAKGYVHKYFTEWMNQINNFNMTNGIGGQSGGRLPYEMSYRKEYVADLHISIYDETTQKIMEYKMRDAWPQMMTEQILSWEEQNQVVKLQVTFLYTDWSLYSEPETASNAELNKISEVINSVDSGSRNSSRSSRTLQDVGKFAADARQVYNVAREASSLLGRL